MCPGGYARGIARHSPAHVVLVRPNMPTCEHRPATTMSVILPIGLGYRTKKTPATCIAATRNRLAPRSIALPRQRQADALGINSV